MHNLQVERRKFWAGDCCSHSHKFFAVRESIGHYRCLAIKDRPHHEDFIMANSYMIIPAIIIGYGYSVLPFYSSYLSN